MFYTNSKIVITKNDAVRVSDTLLPGFNSVVIATHVLTDEQVDAAVNKSQYSENVKKYYANPEHRNAVSTDGTFRRMQILATFRWPFWTLSDNAVMITNTGLKISRSI